MYQLITVQAWREKIEESKRIELNMPSLWKGFQVDDYNKMKTKIDMYFVSVQQCKNRPPKGQHTDNKRSFPTPEPLTKMMSLMAASFVVSHFCTCTNVIWSGTAGHTHACHAGDVTPQTPRLLICKAESITRAFAYWRGCAPNLHGVVIFPTSHFFFIPHFVIPSIGGFQKSLFCQSFWNLVTIKHRIIKIHISPYTCIIRL